MTDQRTFDPYGIWKNYMNQWEKQANDMIQLWTNNREFVKLSKVSSDLQTRYLEIIQKNQQLLANQLNLPTRSDIANATKLSIQIEEKLDVIEEQIWKLQDSIDSIKKESNGFSDVSLEMMKQLKQLKSGQQKYKKELESVGEIQFELQELKTELAEISSLKEELVILKELLAETKDHQAQQERELVGLSK